MRIHWLLTLALAFGLAAGARAKDPVRISDFSDYVAGSEDEAAASDGGTEEFPAEETAIQEAGYESTVAEAAEESFSLASLNRYEEERAELIAPQQAFAPPPVPATALWTDAGSCTSCVAGCTGQGACGNWDQCGCSYIVGGVGLYILKPHWTTNPAFATAVTSGPTTFDQQTDFNYGYDVTPLVWLGYVGENGLGGRIRFWLFDQAASTDFTNDGALTVTSAAPLNYLNTSTTAGDALSFTSTLDLDVIDFDITQNFQIGSLYGQVFAGGRYTRIGQTYVHREIPLTNLSDAVQSSHVFDGFGPSLGAEVRRNIGQSNLSLYGNTRCSILFGEQTQVARNINNSVVTNVGIYSNWDIVPALEAELGGIWETDAGMGRLFVDFGVVGMAFFGAGNSANNQLLINSTDDQADKGATLGMFGFKVAAGMTY